MKKKNISEEQFEKFLFQFMHSPLLKFALAGLSVAILARLAKKMENQFPEISTFMNENLEFLNERVNSLRNSLKNSQTKQIH